MRSCDLIICPVSGSTSISMYYVVVMGNVNEWCLSEGVAWGQGWDTLLKEGGGWRVEGGGWLEGRRALMGGVNGLKGYILYQLFIA